MFEDIISKYESAFHDLAGQAHEGDNVDDLVKQTVNKALDHFGDADNTEALKSKLQEALDMGANLIPDDKPEYKKALAYASSLLSK